MNISEVIEKLEEYKEKYGDIPVKFFDLYSMKNKDISGMHHYKYYHKEHIVIE